jgi:hypothetical protein
VSVRLYLVKEIENKDGYKKEESETSPGWIYCFFANKQIYSGQSGAKEFHLDINDVDESIPKQFQGLISGVSLQKEIPRVVFDRLCGRYQKGTAIATIDSKSHIDEEKRKNFLYLRIVGDNLEDVRELYYQIRAGQILPFENWEAPQITRDETGPDESRWESEYSKRMAGIYLRMARKKPEEAEHMIEYAKGFMQDGNWTFEDVGFSSTEVLTMIVLAQILNKKFR